MENKISKKEKIIDTEYNFHKDTLSLIATSIFTIIIGGLFVLDKNNLSFPLSILFLLLFAGGVFGLGATLNLFIKLGKH